MLFALIQLGGRLAAETGFDEILHVRDVQGETHAQEDRARIVDAFRLAIEGNQPQLAGSGERVAALAGALAAGLGLPNEDADAIYVASLLRDVGELGIDRRILDTPGHLTPEQREIVERHPLLGETILATLAFLSPVAAIVRAHHERWDGTGYPGGLRAEDIPIGARVVAVADAYTAMTSRRPYRAALRASEAMGAVVQARGRAFDPAVVDALIALGGAGTLPLG
ncbi:MAG: HD-GYP domain-containing protein [Candidatus Limnocylindrales bacterium]